MNCKKLFALVISLVLICSSFLMVNAETPALAESFVEVDVTETGLDFALIFPMGSGLDSATFSQNGVDTVRVNEDKANKGRSVTFKFSTTDIENDVTVSFSETVIVCDVSRFTGVGTTYAVYANLTEANANGDEATNIADVVRVKKIIAKAADATSAADVDGDGEVAVADLVLLAKYIVFGKKGIEVNNVTFEDADGKVFDIVAVVDGFKCVAKYTPAKNAAGYDFEGWSASLANITEDTTVTAVYNSNISGTVPDDWELGD